MAISGRASHLASFDEPTLLQCSTCDVRWHDRPDAPCWFCGEQGDEARPQRLIVE